MQALFICRWFLLIWSLGWLALPLSRRVWRSRLADGGVAAGRMMLLCLWSLVALWAGYAGLSTHWGASLIYAVLALLALACWRDRAALRNHLGAHRRGVVGGEIIFAAVFVGFLLLRACWPDVMDLPNGMANGEKPMDLALVASCARADYLPPPNPYVAGTRLTAYYFLGHFETALLSDASAVEPRISYNLMCATVPALCLSMLVALCASIVGSWLRGVAAAFFVIGCGTLQPILQWAAHYQGGGWAGVISVPPWKLDYLATSRIVPFTINEYPWFTFNFGDLHAHLLVMPLGLLLLSLAWSAKWRADGGQQLWSRPLFVVLCACGLGAVILTNSWDFPLYWLALALCLAGPFAGRDLKFRPTGGVAVAVALGCGSLAVAFPFLRHLQSEATGPSWLGQPASPPFLWLLLWGLPLLLWATHLIGTALRRADFGAMKNTVLLAMLGWLVALALLSKELSVLTMILWLCYWTAREMFKEKDATHSWLARIAFCGCLALLWSECTWAGFLGSNAHQGADDFKRLNTVFKFGLQAWFLLGIPAVCASLRGHAQPTGEGGATIGIGSRRAMHLARGYALAMVPITLCSSLAVTVARTRQFAMPVGLDALRGLPAAAQGAASWLNGHAGPKDTLIEAEQREGGDYTAYARYADATGVPTVIGPSAHSFQWGTSWEQVMARKDDVRAFYTGMVGTRKLSASERIAILQKYHTSFVVCGDLERAQYSPAAVAGVEQLLSQVLFAAGSGAQAVSLRAAVAQKAEIGK